MTIDNTPRSVLLIGKSQLVLDESVAGLRDLGYQAEGTNDFAAIGGRLDAKEIDLIVFGGQVPPDRKAATRPKSDSLLLLDDRLARGNHAIPVPDHVPPKAAFATVKIDSAIYAFSIAAEQ
jgi:hypothetical protein